MSLTVTVVIPVFNGARTIGRALESVLSQTRQPNEIIVVDDASTDNTRFLVDELARTSPTAIRVIENLENLGPGHSRNVGWDASRSELVAFLDADDCWHPQKIEVQVRHMESHPNLAMSCHDRSVGQTPRWVIPLPESPSWRILTFKNFLYRNQCATPSVMVRRDIPQRFDCKLRLSEDYFLWLSISKFFKQVDFCPEVLVHCANPAYGGTGLSGNMVAMFLSELRVFHMLRSRRAVTYTEYLLMIVWLTIKFLIRSFDHYVLRDRIQTVSESR